MMSVVEGPPGDAEGGLGCDAGVVVISAEGQELDVSAFEGSSEDFEVAERARAGIGGFEEVSDDDESSGRSAGEGFVSLEEGFEAREDAREGVGGEGVAGVRAGPFVAEVDVGDDDGGALGVEGGGVGGEEPAVGALAVGGHGGEGGGSAWRRGGAVWRGEFRSIG